MTVRELSACSTDASRGGKMKQIIKMSQHNAKDDISRFLNLLKEPDTCLKYIRENYPDNQNDIDVSNLRKQSIQASYCIRQAIEYLSASENTSIITKPLLLYYGFVSLSKACNLICGDGCNSFDFLRRNNLHAHHGLELDKSFSSSKSTNIFELFNLLKATIYYKDSSPWGHFPLFYQIIEPEILQLNGTRSYSGSGITQGYSIFYNSCDKLDINTINQLNLTTFDLVFSLPDLFDYFSYQGVDNNYLAKCSINQTINYDQAIRIQNIPQKRNIEEITNMFIYKLNDKNLKILDYYKAKNPDFQINRIGELNDYQVQLINKRQENSEFDCYMPDICQDLSNEYYCILQPEKYLPESISMYLILFNFGMICRYYPDFWVKIIDQSFTNRNILETLFDSIRTKLQINLLNQITKTVHYF
jgi:hypothetical protein